MRTLASVLDAANRRSASEVTLESEQPVIYRTSRGGEAEQDVLERPALFDMLAAAVSDELQVELMLGNAIEFVHEVQQVKWQVRAVPGADAMIVRAERIGGLRPVIPMPDADEVSVEVDDPSDGFGISLDDALDPDFDLDGPLPPPRAAAPRAASTPAPARAPTPAVTPVASLRDAVPAPFESGTWALEDEDDPEFDFRDAHARTVSMPASESTSRGLRVELDEALPAADAPLTHVEARRPPRTDPALVGIDHAVMGADFIGVPADDDEGVLLPDGRGGLRRRSSAKLAAMGATQGRTLEINPLASPRAETRRELSALGSPDADTHRDLQAQRGTGQPGLVVADIGEGVLAYVLEPGLAEQIASVMQAPTVVLDDEADPDKLWARVRSLAPGSILVVKREDPSSLLGWILRRLEEGYRVLVETRARSAEGARRILLGTDASERAEAWLATRRQVVVESGEHGPTLRPA